MLSPRATTPSRSRRISVSSSPVKKTPSKASPMVSSQSKVRVVARIRPFLAPELEKQAVRCIHTQKGGNTLEIEDISSNQKEAYQLDCCYGDSDDINKIFKAEVEPMMPLLFCGCNATVFAYGATGSGKTYTMQGPQENPGLMPVAMRSILSLAEEHPNCTIHVSYYELYMERCYDLLEPKQCEIPVLEDSEGHVQFRGLAQVQIRSFQEFQNLFLEGCVQRKIGQTKLNNASSRSHGVLMVTVTTTDAVNSGFQLAGKLNLIDLAGNEDNRRSGNGGVRLVESSKINQSLFVLSNVINALNANEKRVPYRDSKLTRILQDSLSGSSCALMIACLNPGSYGEAAQTLSLAARSRQITSGTADGRDATPNHKSKGELKIWNDSSKGKTPIKSPLKKLTSPSPRPCSSKLYSPSRFALSAPQHNNSSARKTPSSPLPIATTASTSTIYSIVEDSDPCSPPTTRVCTVENESDLCTESTGVVDVQTPGDRIQQTSNSPPLSAMLRNFGSSLREALTPLPVNVNVPSNVEYSQPTRLDYSGVERKDSVSEFTCSKGGDSLGWTHVEKFNINSRNLQSVLLKDYLDILNNGSRDDLLQLKGIGKKRADYILKLRENISEEASSSPPFTHLRDLEKIGLSAKQAHSLFHGNVVRQMLTTSF